MGRSGNPAKQAKKNTEAEAKRAVREGKKFLVRPFPNTEVLVSSRDEDEAVEVLKALQPQADSHFDSEHLDNTLAALEGLLTESRTILYLAGHNAEWNERIDAWLEQMKSDVQFNRDVPV